MSWGVRVSEPRLASTGLGEEFWLAYRQRNPVERFTEEKCTPVGALVTVRCDDKEHALFLEELFLREGMPRAAVKVVRP